MGRPKTCQYIKTEKMLVSLQGGIKNGIVHEDTRTI
jgi:hypothetical protein